MKYSLIILILVTSIFAQTTSYNPTNDLDKPSSATAGVKGLKIFKSADSDYMRNWTIDAIIRCLTTERTSTSSYTYNYYMTSSGDKYDNYGVDHWQNQSDLKIGQQLATDLQNYIDKFPACSDLLTGELHAGYTATYDIYREEGEGTETETAGGMACTQNTKYGNQILDTSKAMKATLYVGKHLDASQPEVIIQTASGIYKVCSSDPIVLDLDGDGKLEASNGNYLPHSLCVPESELVAFDINADGFEELVEWVGANDGLLVHDITNNEVSGKNLFGDINGFKDGFEQLATLDTNKDGALTGEELAGLSVWQDKNRNAKIDAGEIHSLESLGITKLNVEAIELTATFERNGKYYMMWDWNPVTIMVKKAK